MDAKKISELDELITATVDDVLAIVNGGATKKIKLSNLTSLKLDVSKVDTDTTLTANSDTKVPSQRAIKTYVDNLVSASVTSLWENKGVMDCSTNPNYPAGVSGDAYTVSVAGKIGGSSGTVVEARDVFVCIADNAGGTQAAVGSSWVVIQANLVQATETVAGYAEIATTSEVNAGTDDQRIVTPAKLSSRLSGMVTGSGLSNFILKWDNGSISTVNDSGIYDDGVNIGIGTDTPLYPLHVKGTTFMETLGNSITFVPGSLEITYTGSFGSSSIVSGNNGTSLQYSSDIHLFASGSGTSIMGLIDSTRAVTLYDLGADATNTLRNSPVMNYNSSWWNAAAGAAVGNTSSIKDVAENTSGDHYLSIGTALRVHNTTNVGIGVSPRARLHVQGTGTSYFTSGLVVEDSSGTDLLTVHDDGSTSIYCTAASGTEAILRAAGSTGSGYSYLHVATNGQTTIGETTFGIFDNNARLTVFGATSDNTTYAMRVCQGSTNPIFAARSDARVAIGNVGGFLTDFTATLRVTVSSSSSSDYVLRVDSSALSDILCVRADGRVGIGTSSPSGLFHIAGNTIRVDTSRTPSSASASGNAGEICWDSGFIYVCVASNTWKRAAISSW